MSAALELLVRTRDTGGEAELARTRDSGGEAELVLCAPTVGVLTQALPEGRAVTPGTPAGVLLQLGRSIALAVPAGVAGRVVSPRAELVHRPVGYGEVLYALAPLSLAGDDSGEDSGIGEPAVRGAGSGPGLRARYAGRFWTRPAPGDPPFVGAGDVLAAGATVGLIEVMKTFTQVHYEPGGELPARARVVRVVPADGAEVGAGDLLVEVEPA